MTGYGIVRRDHGSLEEGTSVFFQEAGATRLHVKPSGEDTVFVVPKSVVRVVVDEIDGKLDWGTLEVQV